MGCAVTIFSFGTGMALIIMSIGITLPPKI